VKLFYASLALTIAGNVLYHLSQKSIPAGVHPMVSIIASYVTAIALSVVVFVAFPPTDSLAAEVRKLNWATVALGVSIVAVELGFLLAYRAGWRVSLASVTANSTVALILLPTGMMFFHERVTLTHVAGLIFCLIGLFLVTR
jgi:uncharacterized membrane protein